MSDQPTRQVYKVDFHVTFIRDDYAELDYGRVYHVHEIIITNVGTAYFMLTEMPGYNFGAEHFKRYVE